MTTRGQWLSRDQRGSIFLSGLMMVFVLTLIGSGMFTATVLEDRLAFDDLGRAQAFYAAQAGMSAALKAVSASA